jgi:hypothetical protein
MKIKNACHCTCWQPGRIPHAMSLKYCMLLWKICMDMEYAWTWSTACWHAATWPLKNMHGHGICMDMEYGMPLHMLAYENQICMDMEYRMPCHLNTACYYENQKCMPLHMLAAWHMKIIWTWSTACHSTCYSTLLNMMAYENQICMDMECMDCSMPLYMLACCSLAYDYD